MTPTLYNLQVYPFEETNFEYFFRNISKKTKGIYEYTNFEYPLQVSLDYTYFEYLSFAGALGQQGFSVEPQDELVAPGHNTT